jgi:hypothetical protein
MRGRVTAPLRHSIMITGPTTRFPSGLYPASLADARGTIAAQRFHRERAFDGAMNRMQRQCRTSNVGLDDNRQEYGRSR